MPLPRHFAHAVLSYGCPSCGHVFEKTASQFYNMGTFTCASCQTRVRMTYDAKLKLFSEHTKKNSPLG